MAAAVGVTPMILSGSSMWSPLGSAIAFGLVGSMFFTLVVIPVIYVLIHQRDSGPGPVVPSHDLKHAGPVAAAVLMLIACGAVAQAQPRKLTLDEAVSLATQHNSMVKIAGDKVRAMDARNRQRFQDDPKLLEAWITASTPRATARLIRSRGRVPASASSSALQKLN